MSAGPSSAAYGELLDAVRGVTWSALRPAASALPGAHRSRLRGSTAEFAEYRLYRQGDDPRRLDWRVLARTDRPYIRIASDRSLLPTTVLLDASASMAFPVPGLDKWKLARQLTVALAGVSHASGDPVGTVIAAGNGVVSVEPLSRSGIVAEIARVVDATQPGGDREMAPLLAAMRTPRVVIITDMLGDNEPMFAAARGHIAGGSEVHLIHIVATEELNPPHGARVVRDPEDPRTERVLSSDGVQRYSERFRAWLGEVAANWRAAGAGYTLVSTEELPASATRRVVMGANSVSIP